MYQKGSVDGGRIGRIVIGLAVLGLTLALATGCAGVVPAGSGSAGAPAGSSSGDTLTNTISVSGTGEASGSPDVAYVQLGIDVVNPDVGRAVAEANTTMRRIMEALAQFDIPEEDIQTVNFNVWPDERYDPQSGEPTGRVYRVQNIVRVRVRDMEAVGEVIQAALDAGATSVNSLSFGIDDTSALEAEARASAVADARERAQQLADALGVRLGDPVVVSEGYTAVPVPVARVAFAEEAVGGAPPISEGELTVSVQVNVVFSIKP